MVNKELYFDDLEKFWNYAMRDSSSRHKDSRNVACDWNGKISWEETKKMARKGWVDGMKEIQKYTACIEPQICQQVMRPNPINAINGYSVDVGAYLSNIPECFHNREMVIQKSPGKIIKIVCSISASCAIKPEIIIQKGALVCALIDAIEYAGYRAEVICNESTSYGSDAASRRGECKTNGWMEISVVVKKANQSLDMCDLAFCLAHPAMLRRIMFSVMELNGWADFAIAYGYPAEATNKGDLYIREIFSETVSNSEAIAWVIQQLSDLGIMIDKKSD